jgi:hypothetical protein
MEAKQVKPSFGLKPFPCLIYINILGQKVKITERQDCVLV